MSQGVKDREQGDRQKGKRFFSGVLILTLSATVIKILGFLCKIPLLHYLGSEGMGYYNTAYEIYALFCVLATAGLPVAMSVMISGSHGSVYAPRAVLRAALRILFPIGLGGTVFLFCFAEYIAKIPQNPGASGAIRAIAPAVLLICLCGVLRGYFQGCGNMVPTALSETTEAAAKLCFSILFASFAQESGKSVVQIGTYATYGICMGTFVSLLTLLVFLARDTKHPPALAASCLQSGETTALLRLSLPITLSAALVSVTRLADMTLILRRLQDTGKTAAEANALFGSYSTLVLPLFGLVPAFVSAIALPLIPNLSAKSEQKESSHALISAAVRLTAVIALPATLGLSLFASPILSLLFRGQAEAVAIAAPLLSVLAVSLLPSCLITVLSAALQAYGRPGIPLVGMTGGLVVKTVIAYILLGIPSIGIFGAPIGALICNLLVVFADLYALSRISGWRVQTDQVLLRPLAASVFPIGGIYLLWRVLPQTHLVTVICILSAVLVYPLFLFLFGCTSPSELSLLLRRKAMKQETSSKNKNKG